MKVLITLDGSSISEAVLEPAKSIVDAMGAEVHLMTVGKPPAQPPPSARLAHADRLGVPMPGGLTPTPVSVPHKEPVETYDQTVDRAKRELLEYLDEKGAMFAPRPFKTRGVLSEHPAQEIIEFARQAGVTVIIMATHGRSGLRAMVQGSVANEVLRSGVAPVMLVRPAPAGEAAWGT